MRILKGRCHRCGGNLYTDDYDDEEVYCLHCARELIEPGKPAPVAKRKAWQKRKYKRR